MIGQHRDAVADGVQRVEVVGNQKDGELEPLLQRTDQFVKRRSADRVEPGRRLVEEQEFRIEGEGPRKRAGLARALALDPELLFLDEPTAGLDPIGAATFDELIRSLQKRLELTVFLITHDLDTLHTICDRVAVLADQKVVAVGTIAELLSLDHPWIQEYFNGPRGRAAADSYKEVAEA